MASKKEDFQMTPEEAERMMEMMKNEEFRKLLAEYAQELNDPANREQREMEIHAMENGEVPGGSGMAMEMVRPEPGYCIRTSTKSGDQKVFVNMCQSERINEAEETTNEKGGPGMRIPFSLANPRVENDKGGIACRVYDVIFNPRTMQRAQADPRIDHMLRQTAFENIEQRFKDKLHTAPPECKKLDRVAFFGKGATIPMRREGLQQPASTTTPATKAAAAMAGKTAPAATASNGTGGAKAAPTAAGTGQRRVDAAIVRDENAPRPKPAATSNNISLTAKSADDSAPEVVLPSNEPARKPLIAEVNSKPAAKSAAKAPAKPAKIAPNYAVVHRGQFEMQEHMNDRFNPRPPRPRELVVRIDLPLISAIDELDLEVSVDDIVLTSQQYNLNIHLPFKVDEDKGSAKFDKSTKQLTLTLPVLPATDVPDPRDLFSGGSLVEEITSDEHDHADGSAHNNSNERVPVPVVNNNKPSVKPDGGPADHSAFVSKSAPVSSPSPAPPSTKPVVAPIVPPALAASSGPREPLYNFNQKLDSVVVKVMHANIDASTLRVETDADRLRVAFSSPEGQFVLDLDLYGRVKPEATTHDVSSKNLIVTLHKEASAMWSALKSKSSSATPSTPLPTATTTPATVNTPAPVSTPVAVPTPVAPAPTPAPAAKAAPTTAAANATSVKAAASAPVAGAPGKTRLMADDAGLD